MIARWIALVFLAMFVGCTDAKTVVDSHATAIEVSTTFAKSLGITQVRISDAGATPHFNTGSLPDSPGAVIDGPQTMMVLLSPDLDGADVLVRVDGLAGASVVATGAAHVTVHAGSVEQVDITLGPPQQCGDGIVSALLEACDDGNTAVNDGCSAGCAFEQGFTCSTPPTGPTTCEPDTFDVVSAVATGNHTVVVTFGDAPDPASALTLAHYSIPGLLLSGTPFISGTTVTLTTSSQTGIGYNVIVAGVTRASDQRALTTTLAAFAGRTSFGVASARSTSATQITVTYDAVPSAAATDPASYTIPGLTIAGTPVLAGTVVTLTTSSQAEIDYTVTVGGVVRASDGEALGNAAVTFTGVNGFDVAGAVSTSNRQIQVTFNAVPNAAQAANLAAYSVPGLTLTNPIVLDGMTVTIATSTQTATTYTVTVGNVTRDSDAQVLANNVAMFAGTPIVAPTVSAVSVIATFPDAGATAWNTGSTKVQLTGAQFASVVCPGGVRLDDPATTSATSCVVDSDAQITATFPAGIRTNGATGWNVIVTNSAGANPSSPPLVVEAGLLVSEVYVPSFTGHEFVELYNPTPAAVNATSLGLQLHVRSATGADAVNPLTIAHGVVPSHGFMLLVSKKSNASDPWNAKLDATYVMGAGIGANGGLYISLSATAETAVLDRVGWGSQPVGGFEGTALADIPAGTSCERLPAGGAGHATDTDMNLADFAPASTTLTPHGTADPSQPP